MYKKTSKLLKRMMDPEAYAFQAGYNDIEIFNVENFYTLEPLLQRADAMVALCREQIEEIERMLNDE